ncbi:MAG TPA: SpoIIE family protein phosphatase, partial [Xanthomonadales bacterium]|nr:SpoIIE family protein phosphatase [Xanthomonadales bacterium]
MVRKRHSLATRLAAWLLLGGLVPLLLLALGIYAEARDQILDRGRADAHALADQAAAAIDQSFRAVRASATMLARDIAYAQPSEAQIIELARTHALYNPQLFGVLFVQAPHAYLGDREHYGFYLSPDEDVLYQRDLAADDYRYWERDWYLRTLAASEPWWSNPYHYVLGDVDLVTINVPVDRERDGRSERLGQVSVDLPLRRVFEVVRGFSLDSRRQALVLAADGTVVWPPQESAAPGRLMIDGLVENGHPELRGLLPGAAPDPQLIVERVAETGWRVALRVSDDELLAPLRGVRDRLLWLGGLGVLALALAVGVVLRRELKPLAVLTQSASHFARGEFDWPLPEHRGRDEVGVLVRALGHARDSLRRYVAELAEATAARQRIESELAIAREIQMAMLPHERELDVGGRHLEIAAVLEPAKAVGGDFYNYFAIDGRLIGFYIGDVSDKGVPAALFMARASTLLEVSMRRLASPGAVLREVGRALCADNDTAMFATVLCGIVDAGHGTLVLASAGHDAPLRLR